MPCSREVGEVGICSAFDDQGSCGLAMYARCERRVCGRATVCKEYCFICEKKAASGVVNGRNTMPRIAGGWRKCVNSIGEEVSRCFMSEKREKNIQRARSSLSGGGLEM